MWARAFACQQQRRRQQQLRAAQIELSYFIRWLLASARPKRRKRRAKAAKSSPEVGRPCIPFGRLHLASVSASQLDSNRWRYCNKIDATRPLVSSRAHLSGLQLTVARTESDCAAWNSTQAELERERNSIGPHWAPRILGRFGFGSETRAVWLAGWLAGETQSGEHPVRPHLVARSSGNSWPAGSVEPRADR